MPEKNIYEFLNEADGSIDDYEKIELTDIEKARLKKTFKKKKGFTFTRLALSVASLALALILFGQTELGKNSYAKVETLIENLTYTVTNSLSLNKELEPYVNVIDKVVEDKGVAVKLTECAILKDEFIVAFLIEQIDEKLNFADIEYRLYINGRKIEDSYSSVSAPIKVGIAYQITEHYVKGIDTKNKLDIKIVIDKISLAEEGSADDKEINGKWKFEFSADGKELSKDTKHIIIENAQFEKNGVNMKLEELYFNPLKKKIYAKMWQDDYHDYFYNLIGEDEFGNEFNFYCRKYSAKNNKGFAIFELSDYESKIDENATWIDIKPVYIESENAKGKELKDYLDFGEKIRIDLR